MKKDKKALRNTEKITVSLSFIKKLQWGKMRKSEKDSVVLSEIHRVCWSVIVNVEMISRIELYEKQNQLLTLKNGQQIKTSPAGYKALRLALNL